ncbi:MAG: hypothetical protein KatS3mg081_1852 [Gemmatimonadales bacterium]|nr:MAG: hypothetical protein KatS3mg081_1852 [Gemmatimonadales bacterium]
MQRICIVSALCAIALAGGVTACSGEPGAPEPSETAALSSNILALDWLDIPAISVGLPPEPRPWDTSEDALISAVKEADGVVVVAFKEPASPRLLHTGVRAAVKAGTLAAGTKLLEALGARIIHRNRSIGAVRARIDPSLVPQLQSSPLVDYIEPNVLAWVWIPAEEARVARSLGAGGSQPLSMVQQVDWGMSLIGADGGAWYYTSGTGTTLGLIDTGHEQGHPDLPAVPTPNCGGFFGGCDDGPGLFTGTHSLGVMAARDNAVGWKGVAYGVQPQDVFVWGACYNQWDPYQYGWYQVCNHAVAADGVDAFRFFGGPGRKKVLSINIGQWYWFAGFAEAVARAWQDGIVVISAGVNPWPGSVAYPQGYDNVIGVSGLTPQKQFPTSSPCGRGSTNYGPMIDLAAPYWARNAWGDSSYVEWCYETVAASHVAGVAALVRAYRPSWSNYQVVSALLNTAEYLGSSAYYGRGLVRALAAINYSPPPPLSVYISGPTEAPPYETCTWTAVASGGSGSYQYDWYYDGQWFASGSYVYTDVGGEGQHSLLVRVNDGTATASDGRTISVFWGAPSCGF